MGGLMYFWELSINTVTTIVLVLVVGLSVDYAAHMAHTFMRYQGTRKGITRTSDKVNLLIIIC